MTSLKHIFIWSLVTIVFLLLLALGKWQLDRLEWKEALLTQIENRLNSAPVEIEEIITDLNAGVDIEYKPVRVTGEFNHEKERHFFATHQGRSGYYVYTPLTFQNGIVFINRGFVEFDLKDPILRPQGQVQGQVTVIGLARSMLNEKPSRIVPDNQPEQNQYYWKDLRSMSQTVGLEIGEGKVQPFFIDGGDAPNPGGYPVGGVTLIDLPNNHLQYAFTWFGLAATLVVICFIFILRRRKQKPE